MMGMKTATSNFTRVWCKIHKDNQWKIDKDLNYYNSISIKCTLQEILNIAEKKGEQLGQVLL
jgi:hypothetical protein